jgi:hypothetical protein
MNKAKAKKGKESSKYNKIVTNLGSSDDKLRIPAIRFISEKIIEVLKKNKNLYCELNGIIDILKVQFDGNVSYPDTKFENLLQRTYDNILQMFDSVLKSLQKEEIHDNLPMVTRCIVYELSDEMYRKLLDAIRGCLFYSVNGYFSFVKSFLSQMTEEKRPESVIEPEEEQESEEKKDEEEEGEYFSGEYIISNPFLDYSPEEIANIKAKRARQSEEEIMKGFSDFIYNLRMTTNLQDKLIKLILSGKTTEQDFSKFHLRVDAGVVEAIKGLATKSSKREENLLKQFNQGRLELGEVSHYFYPTLVHIYENFLPEVFFLLEPNDRLAVLDSFRTSLEELSFTKEKPYKYFGHNPKDEKESVKLLKKRIQKFIKQCEVTLKSKTRAVTGTGFPARADRKTITSIKPFIHFPLVFEAILTNSEVSEEQKTEIEQILKQQEPIVGTFLFFDHYVLKKEDVEYTDIRSEIRKELDKFFHKYPELIRFVTIQADYLVLRAFSYTIEEREQKFREAGEGVPISSSVPLWKPQTFERFVPVPRPSIPILMRSPSMRDTRKRESRKAGYPVEVYICPNEGQNLDHFILGQYHEGSINGVRLYIPNMSFWDNLDAVVNEGEVLMAVRKDIIPVRMIVKGIPVVLSGKPLERVNEICEANRAKRSKAVKPLSIYGRGGSRKKEEELISSSISQRMILELRSALEGSDQRVERYKLYQQELKKRMELIKREDISPLVAQTKAMNELLSIQKRLQGKIIHDSDGIIPLNESTMEFYLDKIEPSEKKEFIEMVLSGAQLPVKYRQILPSESSPEVKEIEGKRNEDEARLERFINELKRVEESLKGLEEIEKKLIEKADGIIQVNDRTLRFYQRKYPDFNAEKLRAIDENRDDYLQFLSIDEIKGTMDLILESLERTPGKEKLEEYVPVGIEQDINLIEEFLRVKTESQRDYIKRGILIQLVLSNKYYAKFFEKTWDYWKYSNSQGKMVRASMTTHERLKMIIGYPFDKFDDTFLTLLETYTKSFIGGRQEERQVPILTTIFRQKEEKKEKEQEQKKRETSIRIIIPKVIHNKNRFAEFEHLRDNYKQTQDPKYLLAETGIFNVDCASPDERKEIYLGNISVQDFRPSNEGIIQKLRYAQYKSVSVYYEEIAQLYSTDALSSFSGQDQVLCMSLYREGVPLEKLLGGIEGIPSIYSRTLPDGTRNRENAYKSGEVRRALLGDANQNDNVTRLLNLYSHLFSDKTIDRLNYLYNFKEIRSVLDILDADPNHSTEEFVKFRSLLVTRPTVEDLGRILIRGYSPIDYLCAVRYSVPLGRFDFNMLPLFDKMWYLVNSEYSSFIKVFTIEKYSDVQRMFQVVLHFLEHNSLQDLARVAELKIPQEQREMILITRNSKIKDCIRFLKRFYITAEVRRDIAGSLGSVIVVPESKEETMVYTIILKGKKITGGISLPSEQLSIECRYEDEFMNQIVHSVTPSLDPSIFSRPDAVDVLSALIPVTNPFNAELDNTEKREFIDFMFGKGKVSQALGLAVSQVVEVGNFDGKVRSFVDAVQFRTKVLRCLEESDAQKLYSILEIAVAQPKKGKLAKMTDKRVDELRKLIKTTSVFDIPVALVNYLGTKEEKEAKAKATPIVFVDPVDNEYFHPPKGKKAPKYRRIAGEKYFTSLRGQKVLASLFKRGETIIVVNPYIGADLSFLLSERIGKVKALSPQGSALRMVLEENLKAGQFDPKRVLIDAPLFEKDGGIDFDFKSFVSTHKPDVVYLSPKWKESSAMTVELERIYGFVVNYFSTSLLENGVERVIVKIPPVAYYEMSYLSQLVDNGIIKIRIVNRPVTKETKEKKSGKFEEMIEASRDPLRENFLVITKGAKMRVAYSQEKPVPQEEFDTIPRIDEEEEEEVPIIPVQKEEEEEPEEKKEEEDFEHMPEEKVETGEEEPEEEQEEGKRKSKEEIEEEIVLTGEEREKRKGRIIEEEELSESGSEISGVSSPSDDESIRGED